MHRRSRWGVCPGLWWAEWKALSIPEVGYWRNYRRIHWVRRPHPCSARYAATTADMSTSWPFLAGEGILGDTANCYPHLPGFITKGGFDENGIFHPVPGIDTEKVTEKTLPFPPIAPFLWSIIFFILCYKYYLIICFNKNENFVCPCLCKAMSYQLQNIDKSNCKRV